MRDLLRQLASLILPVMVLIIIPVLIVRHAVIASGLQLAAGIVVLLVGLWITGETISSFASRGKGTLAPWSPPQHLVVSGMYAYVRNPMILGVIIVLLGEAVTFRSWPLFVFAVLVFLINVPYFVFSEEPGLEKRFGEAYRLYKRNVPRWLPRRTPWKPEDQK